MENIDLYRRNGKKVYIKQPTFQELDLTARLWSDPVTMEDIGGTYKFPEEKWDMFYKKMVYPTDGKNFYCHVYNNRDKFIGEVSFHGYDSSTKAARINIKIHHRQRNKGYGLEAIKLMLEYYFFEFCGENIIDTTEVLGGKKLLKKAGFESISKFRDKETFKITKKRFLSYIPEEPKNVVIVGYDEMKDLYHSLIIEILLKANKIVGEEKFIVNTVGKKEKIIAKNKIINTQTTDFNISYKPDVLIIPGGEGIKDAVKDKEVIKFILSHYDNSDYLLSIEESILILNRCKMLDGISVPVIEGTKDLLLESNSNIRFTDKDFVDFGKTMISANLLGTIEGVLIIVRKVLGNEYYKKLKKELGI